MDDISCLIAAAVRKINAKQSNRKGTRKNRVGDTSTLLNYRDITSHMMFQENRTASGRRNSICEKNSDDRKVLKEVMKFMTTEAWAGELLCL